MERILVPIGDRRFRVARTRVARTSCRHLGSPTGGAVTCQSCAGAVRLKTFACSVHVTCTLDRAAGLACCASCADFEQTPTLPAGEIAVEVTQHANGLGDHAIVLLAAEGLRRANPGQRVVLYTQRGDLLDWLRLWWPDIRTGDVPAGVRHYRPLNERPLGRCGRSRWQWAAERAGGVALAIPPLLPLDAGDLAAVRPFAGAVLLSPEANSIDRPWPRACWIELERLLLARGIACLVLGTNAPELLRFASPPFVRQHPARLAALIRAASAVVGNDSGLVHVAGLIGTPAIALCGLVGGERVFGGYRTVRWIDGPLACNGCEWVNPERELYGCRDYCASLHAIPPAQVAAAVAELVCHQAWSSSLLSPGKLAGLMRAVRETADVAGELAELGVFRGGSALAMLHAAPHAAIHLFDTFTGLPANCPEGPHRAGEFAGDLEQVAGLLRDRLAHLHPGRFPDSAVQLDGLRFRCVHIDADLYESTRDAIAWFWPRLSAGGRLVFDDWQWEQTPGVTRAIRAAFADTEIEETAPHQCQIRKRLPNCH